jgi:CHAT domain-containing protein/Tfp pilus assembly protein PilF
MWINKPARLGLFLLVIAVAGEGFLLHPAPFPAFPVLADAGTESHVLSFPVPGQVATHQLAAGQSASYPVALQQGLYFHVAIEPQGINVRVTVWAPDGRRLVERDSLPQTPVQVSLIAPDSGLFRFEVRSLEKENVQGHYALSTETRPLGPGDNQTIAAEQSFAEGLQLLLVWRAESSRQAIDKFQNALSLWRAAGDRKQEAFTLKRIGDTYQGFGESDAALNYYNQARVLWRELKDPVHEAETLNEISYVYLNLGKNQIAAEICSRALELATNRNLAATARAVHNLGEVSYGQGRLQESLEFFKKALPLWRESGDREGQALTLLNFGYTYSDVGEMKEALDHYEQALNLWTSSGNQRGRGMTLTAIGRLYSRMGESQKALSYFDQARQIIEPIGAAAELGRVFTGIAYVYDQLSDHTKAIEYYNQALPLFRATGDYSGEAVTVYDAARSFSAQGENEKALEYLERALSISHAANDRRLVAFELREMGKVYDSLKNSSKALDLLLKAAAFWKIEKDYRAEADTLNPIGRIYQARGDLEQALSYYNRARALCRQAEYPTGEAATIYNIAQVERDRGKLDAALELTEAGLQIVESLRTRIVSQDLRAAYLASMRQHYELYIDVLMRLDRERPGEGLAAKAFQISEKARARSLLESLKEARADIREGVEPAMLAREISIEQSLNTKAAHHAQLVADPANTAEADKVAKEIDQLTTEHQSLEAQIRLNSPRYAALTQPTPLSLLEVQNQLLNDDTLLLEYMLGDERSYVWAVSQNEFASFELPGRAQLEIAALSFHKLLTANQPLPGETFAQRQDRVREAQTRLPQEAASFSRLVLGPVLSKLGRKRLLVVADGALQYIPFQALVVPATIGGAGAALSQTIGGSEDLVPLIVDHEIVNEPSASTLALVLKETAQRKQAPNTIAVFANPVFEADDLRVKSETPAPARLALSPPETTVREVFRDARLGEGLRIPALPASGQEADSIIAVVPWRTGFKAEGFEASRATIMRPELAQYRIVHFATHGFVNYQQPGLSGLVLSLVDEKGRAQDGFLRMHDIYNLKLPVDLVVLSACNTALGKDVKGEGLIGLTRGFMYAGAGGVVASLWKVDDDATAELMTHFYEGMFKRGLTPAAALREAQLSLWRQKNWHSSYYWAAFVIQGQYNQQVNSRSVLSPFLRVFALSALVGGLSLVVFFLWRRRRSRFL